MPSLYGSNWQRRDLEARAGRIEQFGGIRRMHLADGGEAGSEAIQVRTGAGLAYWVLPSRGLDISLCEFAGSPISWQAAAGDLHPSFYDSTGANWLRTAAGGLLMTCGLTSAGSPCSDAGEALGLHGRVHHQPARQVAAQADWEQDDQRYVMRISGIVEENSLFGHNLRLKRCLTSVLGENSIYIDDRVENLGFAPAPHMLLYHFNFGFPLLNADTQLHFPSQSVRLRENTLPLPDYQRWSEPDPQFREQVFYHENLQTRCCADMQWAEAKICTEQFPIAGSMHKLSLSLGWDTRTLPRLVQWKMPGAGAHVMGIEPANCYVEGRAQERARGTLVELAPGQALDYHLKLSLTTI